MITSGYLAEMPNSTQEENTMTSKYEDVNTARTECLMLMSEFGKCEWVKKAIKEWDAEDAFDARTKPEENETAGNAAVRECYKRQGKIIKKENKSACESTTRAYLNKLKDNIEQENIANFRLSWDRRQDYLMRGLQTDMNKLKECMEKFMRRFEEKTEK